MLVRIAGWTSLLSSLSGTAQLPSARTRGAADKKDVVVVRNPSGEQTEIPLQLVSMPHQGRSISLFQLMLIL